MNFLGTLSAVDTWLHEIENNNNSVENKTKKYQGNLDLASLLFQEISLGGKLSQSESTSSSIKDPPTFNNKKNPNMIPGSGSGPGSSGVLSGIGSSSLLNSIGSETVGESEEDLLRCFAMVYERKGICCHCLYVS